MDNTTNITYEEVRQDAENIKDNANTMKNIFDDFIATMNAVYADDVFAGNASESLETKFLALKGRLSAYTKTVEHFSATILGAADATETTEQALAANIDNLAG